MNNRLAAVTCAFVALTCCASAQVLTDDFEDNVIDLGKWTPTDSFPTSRTSESNGVLHLVNRGMITAVPDMGPATITCRFRFTGHPTDRLYVVIRSDGTIGGQFGFPLSGLRAGMHATADGSSVEFGLAQNVPNRGLASAPSPFPIVVGEFYDFSVVDDGTTVQMFVNNQLVLSHETKVDDGDRIHIANRERYIGDYAVEMDWIEIVQEGVDIQANGSDGLVVLSPGEPLTLTADLVANPAIEGDTWILTLTSLGFPFTIFSYDLAGNFWLPWLFTFNGPSAQGAIPALQSATLLESNGLPNGFYTFYLGYDPIQNRQIDVGELKIDAVSVIIGD